MKFVRVVGKNNKHKVRMYALSTCPWCMATKQFLKDNNIEFEYVDADKSDENDKEEIRKDILNRGGSLAYPRIIVDDKVLISGFDKERIKKEILA